MLEWLAGVQRADGGLAASNDEPQACNDDAPDTPAPVFAARAFKQLIWGTPKPEEMDRSRAQPRRRTSRPQGPVPKASAPIVSETDQITAAVIRTPTKSPSKRPGILLTPGTGGTRRKTVSFERKPYNYQNGALLSLPPTLTPREVPGKFPAPTVPRAEDNAKLPSMDLVTNAASAVKQSTSIGLRTETYTVEDITLDMTAPRSLSGNYWKTEYDSFSTKSAVELRKLAKKEQVAKKYAKSKDSEAAKLAEMLHNEESKVYQLQKQVDDYVNQLSLIVKSNSEKVAGNHIEVHGRTNKPTRKRSNGDGDWFEELANTSPPRSSTRQLEAALTNANATIDSLRNTNKSLEAEVSRLMSDCQRQQSEIARLKGEDNAASTTPRSQSRRRPRTLGEAQDVGIASDIWADVGNDMEEPLKVSGKGQRALEKAPLRQKNMNIGDKEQPTGKDSGLTDERREAAKKRLEERRRNREKGGVAA